MVVEHGGWAKIQHKKTVEAHAIDLVPQVSRTKTATCAAVLEILIAIPLVGAAATKLSTALGIEMAVFMVATLLMSAVAVIAVLAAVAVGLALLTMGAAPSVAKIVLLAGIAAVTIRLVLALLLSVTCAAGRRLRLRLANWRRKIGYIVVRRKTETWRKRAKRIMIWEPR